MPAEEIALQRDRNMASDPRIADRAKDWLKKSMGNFRSARMFHERDWVRQVRAYKMLTVTQGYVGRSNLRMPHVRNMVERLVQKVVSNLVGREDFFEVMPTRPEDEPRAEVIRAILSAQMEEEGYRREQALLVRDAIVIGTAVKKVRWKYDVEMVQVPTYQGDQWIVGPEGPTLKPVFDDQLQERVLCNRPDGRRLNPFNIYMDPAAQDFDHTDTVEVGYLTPTEVFKQIDLGVFEPTQALRAIQQGGTVTKSMADPGYRQVFDIALGLRTDGSSKQTQYLRYHEFWGWFPLEAASVEDQRTARMERVVIGVLGEDFVVRVERNPHLSQKKPYQRGVIIEIPGQFYGDSPVKAALPQWQELNDCRNQSNDARSFAVNPVMLRQHTSGEDKKTSQRIFPGAIITGNGLEFAAFPDVTGPAFVAEAVMTREMEETFGAPRLLDAQSDANSATEVAIEKEESVARILGYVKTFEETEVIPELRFRMDLNRQFLRTADAVRIRGQNGFEWRPYTPLDFLPSYDFLCLGSVQMQSRAMLNASFAATTDRMLAFEQLAPGTFDWVRWWGTYFRDGLGIEHPSLYINPMKRAERVATVDEVILMLTQGQRPEPDPRQDFLQTLPILAAFISQRAGRMPPDLEKNFREYFRKSIQIAQQVLMAKQAMMMQAAQEEGPGGVSPQGGGAKNKAIGSEQRDGKGNGTPRRAMEATRKGVQP